MRKVVIPVVAVLVLGVATAAVARVGLRGGNEDRTRGQSLLGEALDDVVEDGTITQEQSDAIVAALEEKRSEALEAAKAALDQLKAFWEDDVLTSDEISRLPFAERFEGRFEEALEDGQLTKEELDEIRSERSPGHGRFGHHRHGPARAVSKHIESL